MPYFFIRQSIWQEAKTTISFWQLNSGEGEEEDAENRFLFGRLGLGASVLNKVFFNNRFGNNVGSSGGALQSLAGVTNQLPIIINPNYPTLLSKFQSCTSLNQEDGICSPGAACSLFGGRPSGSCGLQSVCCVSKYTSPIIKI